MDRRQPCAIEAVVMERERNDVQYTKFIDNLRGQTITPTRRTTIPENLNHVSHHSRLKDRETRHRFSGLVEAELGEVSEVGRVD